MNKYSPRIKYKKVIIVLQIGCIAESHINTFLIYTFICIVIDIYFCIFKILNKNLTIFSTDWLNNIPSNITISEFQLCR